MHTDAAANAKQNNESMGEEGGVSHFEEIAEQGVALVLALHEDEHLATLVPGAQHLRIPLAPMLGSACQAVHLENGTANTSRAFCPAVKESTAPIQAASMRNNA